jgi:hypothetical protein
MNEKFVEVLTEIDKKLDFQEKLKYTSALASNEMKPHLENLKMFSFIFLIFISVVVDKIKKFLIVEFGEFKKPKASVKEIQEKLLKFKFFFKFLTKHSQDISKEIRILYVDAVSKIYYSHIYAHRCDLLNYEEKIAKTAELLIEPESTSIFYKPTKHNGKSKSKINQWQ